MLSVVKQLDHLRIPLEQIENATNNFNEQNLIGKGGYGRVYSGQLSNINVAVKRLDRTSKQGEHEFLAEIATLSSYAHDNLVSLVGFCDGRGEKILVYKFAIHGSLDKYLVDTNKSNSLTWAKRLKICIGAARGLDHLHNRLGSEHRVIHRDVKSSNILLDENWKAKVSDFGLSKMGPANQLVTFLISNAAGTFGYCDPQYEMTGILTKESGVYSFGVVLFEVLCGRLACIGEYHDERRFLAQLAQLCFEHKKLHEIIDPKIKEQIGTKSLGTFSAIAYQCLRELREERPTMDLIVKELENALHLQKTWDDMESGDCLIINSRSLNIVWGDDNRYWRWNHIKETSGKSIEVAELNQVCWLDVNGKFKVPDLYLGVECEIAYLVKLENRGSGWKSPITLRLSHPHGGDVKVQECQISLSQEPKEQWIELHIGNFLVEDGENKEVTFGLYEIGSHWKSGLVIKHVVIRKVVN